MLESRELRVGNLVCKILPFSNKVKKITVGDLALIDGKGSEEDYFPIPLTEEWLLKAGFVKNTYPNLHWFKYLDNDDKVAITEHKEYGSNKHLSFFFNCSGSMSYSSIDLQVIYVHTLQNLFFALTGTELEFSLP